MNRQNVAAMLLTVFLVGGVAHAATIAPPENLGELARLSTAVVLAEALDSTGLRATAVQSSLPYTLTRFRRIEEVGGARVGAELEVIEPGGEQGDRATVVGGAPTYEAGRTYLLFLELRRDGYWGSRMLAYGLLVEDPATGLLEPLPEVGGIEAVGGAPFEPVTVYAKDALIGHLREVLAGAAWDRGRAGAVLALDSDVSELAPPTGCVYLTYEDDPIRWFGWETGAAQAVIRATTPGQTGVGDGGVSAVQQGAAAWKDHPNSLVRYGTPSPIPRTVQCSGDLDAEQGAVWFNDPCSDIPPLSDCVGTLGFGGVFFYLATQPYDGAQWHPAVPGSSYVVVNNGAQCIGGVGFKELLTHEVGHTLGFGHHAATPAPNPTMSAFLKNDGRGAALVGRDRTCASFAYHTFLDVPYDHTFWSYIEAIQNRGAANSCAPGKYCPNGSMSRAQMARYLLRSKHGSGYDPPACTAPGPFNDVPCSHSQAAWIEELADRGIVAGCGNGNYCPGSGVTRAQMAVFLLRTLEGSGYTPAECSSSPFADVPVSSPFCPWIREIVNREITSGCGGGNYCPASTTQRGQMAVFLTRTFELL